MGRRSSAIAFRFRRLYITQLPYFDTCRDAYYHAEEIWMRHYGHYCYRSYLSFSNAMSRWNKLHKLKI
jgi:hypothetical protein